MSNLVQHDAVAEQKNAGRFDCASDLRKSRARRRVEDGQVPKHVWLTIKRDNDGSIDEAPKLGKVEDVEDEWEPRGVRLALEHHNGEAKVGRGDAPEAMLQRMRDSRDVFDPPHLEPRREALERPPRAAPPAVPLGPIEIRRVEEESEPLELASGDDLLLVVELLFSSRRVGPEDDELVLAVDLRHEVRERVGRREDLVVVEVQNPPGGRHHRLELEEANGALVTRLADAVEVRLALRSVEGCDEAVLVVSGESSADGAEIVVLGLGVNEERQLDSLDGGFGELDDVAHADEVLEVGVRLRGDGGDEVGCERLRDDPRENRDLLAVRGWLINPGAVVGLTRTVGVVDDGEGRRVGGSSEGGREFGGKG